jgi:hypothetical protein
MDSIGKKCLHAFFGAILGLGIGFLVAGRLRDIDNLIWYCIGGAISIGVLAFFGTDHFWESLRKD